MIEITVKLYGGLRIAAEQKGLGALSEKGLLVSFNGRVTVREVLKHLRISEDDVHLTFVDRKRISFSDEVYDGKVLHVFPPMAGG